MDMNDQSPVTDDALDAAANSLAQGQDRFALASTLDRSLDVNPEAAAKTQQLSQKTGIPLPLVDGREKDVERDYNLRPERIDKINQLYPALRNSLQEEDFTRVAHDDIETLMKVEDLAPTIMRGESDSFDEVIGGFQQTANAHAMLGLAYNVGNPEDFADFIVNNEKMARDRAARYPGYVKEFNEEYAPTKGVIAPIGAILSNPRAAVRQFGGQIPGQLAAPIAAGAAGSRVGATIGASAGSVVPGVGTAAGGTIGGLTGFAAGTFGASVPAEVGSWMIQTLQSEGVDLTNRDAIIAAVQSPKFQNELKAEAERKGLTTAAIDSVTAPLQGKFLRGARGTGTKAVTKAVAKEAAIGTASDIASEGGGQLAAYEGDVSKVSAKDIVEEVIVGQARTAAETVIGSQARGPIKELAKAVAEDKTAQFTAAHEVVRESKLVQRNPERFRGMVEKAAPGEKVYVDGAAGVEFFQSLPPERQNALVDAIPDLKDRLSEAAVAGTDIPLNKSDYFAYIAPHTEADSLSEHVRFSQNDYTIAQLNDIDSLISDAEDALADAEDGLGLTEVEATTRRIEQELTNAGRTPEVARLEAGLVRANLETFGSRYGADDKAMSIINDAYSNLTIRGPQAQPFSRRKIDNTDLLIDSLRNDIVAARKKADFSNYTVKTASGQSKRISAKAPEEAQTKAKAFADENRTDVASVARSVPRAQGTKYPVLSHLVSMGGFGNDSPVAAELRAIGVTNKTIPGIFRRRTAQTVRGLFGLQEGKDTRIDGIPASEWPFELPPEFDNSSGYVDIDYIYEEVRRELAGDPITRRMQYLSPEDALSEELDRLGIDVTTASNEEIKAALNNQAVEDQVGELFQGSDRPENPRGSIQYQPDGKTVVNVFEGADLSTVLHEFGHFYWGLFDKLANAGALNESGKKDWQAVRDYVGAKEGEALNVNQEEIIARSFEAYLMEGKAPSIDLQQAFSRFKAWLTRIYRSVKSLDVKLTDDVRAVFDRMLATDDAIEAMKGNQLFAPDPNVEALLNEEQKVAYRKQVTRAAETAKEKLFRKTMRQHERIKTQWWKDEREKLRQEIDARVGASPVYKVLDAMQKGLLPDGSPIGESVRLSRRKLREAYGNEIFQYMPRATVAETEAVANDHEIIAEQYGFGSGDSMIKAIINAEDRKTKVERQTDEEMMNRHGDLLNDGTLEREAMTDYHNGERALQLAAELKAVASKAGVTAAAPEQFKSAAERVLGAKKIDDAIKPSRFYFAEVKASREFGKALAKQDYVKAADAKRRQMMNHFLYRQSRDADTEVRRALKGFDKLQKPAVRGKVKIDEDYHNKIREILSAYGFGARMSAAKQTRLELKAIAQWMAERETNEDAQLEIPLEILSAEGKTHFRDMTLEEFRGLRDMVSNIETQGRRKLQYQIDGRQRDFEALISSLVAQAESSGPIVDRPINPSPLSEFAQKFFAVQTKAREYFRRLDGGNRLGLFHDAVLNDIDAGIDRLSIRHAEASVKFKALLEASYTREELAKMADRKFNVEGLRDGMTHENLLMMALNWGNEGNRKALLHGENWDFGVVDKVLKDRLTSKDWDFVEGVWDWINSYWPEAAALEKRRRGFTPKKVEAYAFEIPDKRTGQDGVATKTRTIKGGYFPISADPKRSITTKEQTLDEVMKDMRSGSMAYAATKQGHLKKRVGVGLNQRPLKLHMSVISRHVNQTLRDIELGEAIHQASRVIRNKSVKKTMADRLGMEAYSQLDLWLKDTAVGDMAAGDPISAVMDKLRSNATIAYMGFSLSTFVQQGSGLTQTAAVLGNGGRGWKWVGVGVKKLMQSYTNGPAMTVDEIHGVSDFMAMRSRTFSRDINDAMNLIHGNIATKTSFFGKYLPADYKKWFLLHIQKAQSIVDAISWLGAHAKAESEGLDAARAIKYADDVVRAQASGLIQDLSGIERGSFSPSQRFNKMTKLFTFMFSYWNAKYNVASGKAADVRAGRLSAGAFAVDMINLIWIEALIGDFLTGRLTAPGDDDEDDEYGTLDKLWWLIKQPLNIAPFGRDIVGGLEGHPPATPLAAVINATANAKTQIAQGDADVAAVKSLVSLGGLLIGLPSSQLNRFISMADRVAKDKEVGYIDLVRARKSSEP